MRIVIETTGRIPTLKEVEREYIRMIYEEMGRNKVRTAKVLGVSVRTLRMKQAWLQLPPALNLDGTIRGGDGIYPEK